MSLDPTLRTFALVTVPLAVVLALVEGVGPGPRQDRDLVSSPTTRSYSRHRARNARRSSSAVASASTRSRSRLPFFESPETAFSRTSPPKTRMNAAAMSGSGVQTWSELTLLLQRSDFQPVLICRQCL